MKVIVKIGQLLTPGSRNTVALLGFVIALSMMAPPVSADSAPGVKVSGTVFDPNHASLGGVTVTASSAAWRITTRTDGDGNFSFNLSPGDYEITFEAEGFERVSQLVEVKALMAGSLAVVMPLTTSTATVTIVATDTLGYRSDSTSSATRTLTDLRDIPQSIVVVGKEQVADQSLKSIADVVNYVPGITSHQGENNRDQLVIRGVSSSADFFLNGMRDDVQYYRDLYNLERIEALKGPNAMSFGRGGGGGVINRVSKQAGFSKLRELVFTGGSFRDRRIVGDVDQPLNGTVALRLNGVYENSDSFRQFVYLNRYGISPTVSINAGAGTRITFGYEHFYDGRLADRGMPSFAGKPIDLPIDTYFGNPNDSYAKARVDRWYGTIQKQFSRLLITNRTMFGDYDRSYQNYVPGAVNASKTTVAMTAYNNATQRRNLFNQTDATWFTSTGRVKHTLLFGVDVGRQLTDNFRNTGFFNNTSTSIQAPLTSTAISTPVTFRQSATDADNHLTTNLAAGFAQDQIEVSRHVQLLAGVRFDYFDLQFHNRRTGENLRRIDRLVSPRAGIVVKPVTQLSLYGSYSISYLPSSGDQFSSLTVVTQQVKPESFANYEVGAKWDVRSNLTLTAALYRQDRTNTRATDPNEPTRMLQTGSQRTNGFEAGANGNLTRYWTVAGGYSRQDAFIRSATTAARAGAQVAMVPHHTFSLWNKFQLISKLQVGLGIIHRSDMYAAIDNGVTLPGYTKIDAAVFIPFAERWKLQANFENLFNRKYFLNADGNNNISPGSPRAVRVSLITRF